MSNKTKISQFVISAVTLFIFILIVVLLGGSIIFMKNSINAEQEAVARKEEFKQLGIDLKDASDYLTDEARKFAVTNDRKYMDNYWREIDVTKTRDKVIYRIIELNTPADELSLLAEAKKNSDGLVETEKRSMRLVLEAHKVSEHNMPDEVTGFHLSNEDQQLNEQDKLKKAIDIMYDAKYDADKKTITNPISNFQKSINNISEIELESARTARLQAETLQIVLSFIIIFSIAVLLRIISTQLTIPIKNYTKELTDLNFNNSNFELMPDGSKELRALADNFNKMYYSLKDELVKRKKAEETMKAAKEEAEEANMAKSQFLANMSHEIRTPLNAIIGYEYVLQNTALTDKQRNYTNKIFISAKNLLEIINNILDFSKIEAKKLIIEKISFDIYEILEEISSMVYFEIERKGLKINCSIEKGIPKYLIGDPVRIKQIILNIVSNAIKFTQTGGLNIDAKLVQKLKSQVTIKFIIKDTGIGISQQQKKLLFKPFTQADASTTRKYGGTGLGLTISKQLVELMGGSIYVESELGEGTAFYFTLKFDIPDDVLIEKCEYSSKDIFKNKKILLVEDNEINLEMTKAILESFGFETDTADSGLSAIEKINKNIYDVVLMDIQMPSMDGYETTRRIRKIKGTERLPIIALSADVVYGVIDKVKNAGMNDYITKPLNIESLVRVLKNYIKIDEEIPRYSVKTLKNHRYCIDFESAVKKIGDKVKYRDVLGLFISNHKGDAEILHNCVSAENWEDLQALVHTMKGIAGNIEAQELYEFCRVLENNISKHDKGYLFGLIKNFESILNSVLEDADKIIINELRQKVSTTAKINDEDTEEKIAELIKLLKAGNVEAKDVFNECKQYFERTMGQQSYCRLKTEISNYAFEEAYYDITKKFQEIDN